MQIRKDSIELYDNDLTPSFYQLALCLVLCMVYMQLTMLSAVASSYNNIFDIYVIFLNK